ncbi:Fetuin-B [Acipenser ruthenus]|uniref:Fetuin-B n=1 Tax=Acipenser ruthenus TaxID=7906 RepID=A0A444TWV7_ACIRT|nr:Fetuin-B [Acipenser ruthenus]
MNLLSFLVVGTLLACTWSLPPTGFPLQTVSCNDTDVDSAAALALQSINKEREEGNVLSLFRINAVQKQHWRRGAVFYLAFNVIDTNCHVLSRKDYKECEVRYLHEADRREHYHSLTHDRSHGREKRHGHGQRCGQGHGQEHGQRHAPDHSQGHGQEHGQRHAPDHSQGHGQEHGQRHAPDHSQGHGQEHGQRHAHGHSQGHGQEHGQRHAHGHSQGHGQEHGQRHTHDHSQGHTQEHGQRPAHDHSQGHGLSRGCDEGLVEEGLVTESIQERHNDSLEGHGFHVYSRRPVGSVIVLPQSTNQVDLPDPVLSLPEITGPWISNAAILPFPDKSSPECPAEPKLPQLWVLDLLKPIK